MWSASAAGGSSSPGRSGAEGSPRGAAARGVSSPLHAACIAGDSVALQELLERKAAPLELLNPDGFSAMHLCVKHGWADCLELLLEAGADTELRVAGDPALPDSHFDGYTAAHMAALLPGRNEALARLLRHGACHARAPDGWTPLHCAAFAGRHEAMRLLLEHDAPPDDQAHDGRGALHLSARAARPRAVRLLLHAGADPTLRDGSGRTPLHYCFAAPAQRMLAGALPTGASCHEVAYLLELAGGDPSAADDDAVCPLSFVTPSWQEVHRCVARFRKQLLGRGGVLPQICGESSAAGSPQRLERARSASPGGRSPPPPAAAEGRPTPALLELLQADAAALVAYGVPAECATAFRDALAAAREEIRPGEDDIRRREGADILRRRTAAAAAKNAPPPPSQSLLQRAAASLAPRKWRGSPRSLSPRLASPRSARPTSRCGLMRRYCLLRCLSRRGRLALCAVVALTVLCFWLGVMAERYFGSRPREGPAALAAWMVRSGLPDPWRV